METTTLLGTFDNVRKVRQFNVPFLPLDLGYFPKDCRTFEARRAMLDSLVQATRTRRDELTKEHRES